MILKEIFFSEYPCACNRTKTTETIVGTKLGRTIIPVIYVQDIFVQPVIVEPSKNRLIFIFRVVIVTNTEPAAEIEPSKASVL